MSTTSKAIFSNPLFASYSVYARNASIMRTPNIQRVT